MLALRSIAIILGGLLFIFLPGAVIGALSRKGYRYDRTFLLLGMGVLIVALLPASYLTSLLRLLILPDAEADLSARILLALFGSALTGIFLEGAKYLALRWRKPDPARLPSAGVMIGLGVGLLNKVFLGLVLVGVGIRLLLGSTLQGGMSAELGQIAWQPWPSLVISLAALITDRMAIILVSAALGSLVARALLERRLRWLWLAMAASAAFSWVYSALDLWLGIETLAAGLIVIVYEGGLALLALRWLAGRVEGGRRPPLQAQKATLVGKSRGSAGPGAM